MIDRKEGDFTLFHNTTHAGRKFCIIFSDDIIPLKIRPSDQTKFFFHLLIILGIKLGLIFTY